MPITAFAFRAIIRRRSFFRRRLFYGKRKVKDGSV